MEIPATMKLAARITAVAALSLTSQACATPAYSGLDQVDYGVTRAVRGQRATLHTEYHASKRQEPGNGAIWTNDIDGQRAVEVWVGGRGPGTGGIETLASFLERESGVLSAADAAGRRCYQAEPASSVFCIEEQEASP
jgi:hypothetical protein